MNSNSIHEVIESMFGKLPTYIIKLGIFEMDQNNQRDEKTQVEEGTVQLTNAKLMFIHEYGSPLQHIPKRPVIGPTVEWANKYLIDKAYDKIISVYLETLKVDELEKAIEKYICMPMEKYARKMIYANDGRLKANSYRTIHGGYIWVSLKDPMKSKYKSGKAQGKQLIHIKGKGYNHPLYVTGQLARSITCKLVKV